MIRIGPAGWKYKDWEGVVYPTPAPRGFDALAYIADYFTAVEINSSYYGPPRPATAQKWLRSVSHNSQFRFTAKLFHSFTHERKPGPDDERDFKSGIGPLLEAGRLGALLIQFPWSFKNEPHNREYLWHLQGSRWSSKSVTRAGSPTRFWARSRNSESGCVISISPFFTDLYGHRPAPLRRSDTSDCTAGTTKTGFLNPPTCESGMTTSTPSMSWDRGLRASRRLPRMRLRPTQSRTTTIWGKRR